MTGNGSLRAGVVGVGSMGANHARVYRELTDVDLVGVSDQDTEAASRVADEYSTTSLDLGALLDAADLVTVAVPTAAHASVVRDCLDAGVNVLVEKPFVTDLNDGRALAERARERDLTLQIGHVERFNPAVRTLLTIVPDIDVIAVDARRLGPPVERDMGMSVPLDLMVHDIDILRALQGGDPCSLSAFGTSDGGYATAQASFSDGVVASLTASRLTQRKVRRLEVTARECHVSVDYIDQSVEIHRDSVPTYVEDDGEIRHRTGSVVERPVVESGEPLKAELASFADAVRTGRDPLVTAEDGLRAVEVAQRVESLIATDGREEVTL